MTWERVSPYAIKSGDWIISKVFVDDCTLYQLFHGDKLIGYFNDADEAKAAARNVELTGAQPVGEASGSAQGYAARGDDGE